MLCLATFCTIQHPITAKLNLTNISLVKLTILKALVKVFFGILPLYPHLYVKRIKGTFYWLARRASEKGFWLARCYFHSHLATGWPLISNPGLQHLKISCCLCPSALKLIDWLIDWLIVRVKKHRNLTSTGQNQLPTSVGNSTDLKKALKTHLFSVNTWSGFSPVYLPLSVFQCLVDREWSVEH